LPLMARRRDRLILGIAGLFLSGVVVSLGTAWLCAAAMDVFRIDGIDGITYRTGVDSTRAPAWTVQSLERAATTWIFFMRMEWEGPEDSRSIDGEYPDDLLPGWSGFAGAETKFDEELGRWDERMAFAYGWPFRSFWYELEVLDDFEMAVKGGLAIGTYSPRPDFYDEPLERALPLRPILSGLIANSAIYAACLSILIAIVRWQRAWRRLNVE
jgi:hypothetical protein